MYEAEIDRTNADFGRHWRSYPATGGKPSIVEEVDAAGEKEFGASLTDLVTFLSAAMVVGRRLPPEAKVLPLAAFLEAVQAELSWEAERVRVVQGLFTSRTRDDFLRVRRRFRDRMFTPGVSTRHVVPAQATADKGCRRGRRAAWGALIWTWRRRTSSTCVSTVASRQYPSR